MAQGQFHFTFSLIVSMASSTQPTVPSPPHTSTRTLPGGSRVQSWRALEGESSDKSNTWRKDEKRDKFLLCFCTEIKLWAPLQAFNKLRVFKDDLF